MLQSGSEVHTSADAGATNIVGWLHLGFHMHCERSRHIPNDGSVIVTTSALQDAECYHQLRTAKIDDMRLYWIVEATAKTRGLLARRPARFQVKPAARAPLADQTMLWSQVRLRSACGCSYKDMGWIVIELVRLCDHK